jgi:hypothetical protein
MRISLWPVLEDIQDRRTYIRFQNDYVCNLAVGINNIVTRLCYMCNSIK